MDAQSYVLFDRRLFGVAAAFAPHNRPLRLLATHPETGRSFTLFAARVAMAEIGTFLPFKSDGRNVSSCLGQTFGVCLSVVAERHKLGRLRSGRFQMIGTRELPFSACQRSRPLPTDSRHSTRKPERQLSPQADIGSESRPADTLGFIPHSRSRFCVRDVA
jgi:hypothetical protein